MKTNILWTAALAVALATSCSDGRTEQELLPEEAQKHQAHLKLIISTPEGTRASLLANDKALTDLYIMDYDKETGKLLQVLHQTSSASDFAEPDLTLDYGAHTLKVIATRSDSPTLMDATGATWAHTENVLTPATSNAPVTFASTKTSDTFGAQQDVTIGTGSTEAVSMGLDRLVAKLVISPSDQFPADCSTILVDFKEHKAFALPSFEVADAVNSQRVSDVSTLAGTSGNTISYFVMVPAKGYKTDVTFTMNRKDSDTPYASFTISDVAMYRNEITKVSGPFYNHQQGFRLVVNDTWSEDVNVVNF